MGKKNSSLIACMLLLALLLAGCGGNASAPAAQPEAANEGTSTQDGEKYAFVVRSAGNPYIKKEEEGFKEAVEAMGGEVLIKEPDQATAEAQISMIQSVISQGVDSIAVGANDTNALSSALQEAQEKRIKVLTIDADVNPADRSTFINQAGTEEIGQALIDAVLDICGGEGDYAILSATSQSTNQNAWIEAMEKIAEEDEKYSKLNLVEVAYGDDEPQKSTDQTQALLSKYPNLKVICAPTTIGIAAAGKVLQDTGSDVKLTGLGLPSEMSAYIGEGSGYPCPYMFLWNPIELGKLGGYTAVALVRGNITGKVGDTFEAGDMENSPYTLTALESGEGSEVILGPPFRFDSSNIDEWKEIY